MTATRDHGAPNPTSSAGVGRNRHLTLSKFQLQLEPLEKEIMRITNTCFMSVNRALPLRMLLTLFFPRHEISVLCCVDSGLNVPGPIICLFATRKFQSPSERLFGYRSQTLRSLRHRDTHARTYALPVGFVRETRGNFSSTL